MSVSDEWVRGGEEVSIIRLFPHSGDKGTHTDTNTQTCIHPCPFTWTHTKNHKRIHNVQQHILTPTEKNSVLL